jgi:hypothetical protein
VSLDVVSCPTRAWCLAAGFDGPQNMTFADTLEDGQWAAATQLPYKSQPNTISCAAPGVCALGVDGTVLEMLAGGQWQSTTGWQTGLSGDLGAISCATSSRCTAVGTNGEPGTSVAILS